MGPVIVSKPVKCVFFRFVINYIFSNFILTVRGGYLLIVHKCGQLLPRNGPNYFFFQGSSKSD